MKIYIIDDIQRDLQEVKRYLTKEIKGIQCETFFLKKDDGKSTRKYSVEEHKNIVKKELSDKWEEMDIFLIDVALRGSPIEEPMVSEQAVKEFLENNVDCYNQLKAKNKYIIFITNKWLSDININLDKDMLQSIIYTCKPDTKESHPIDTQYCENKDICSKFHDHTTECERNKCLVEIIKTLIKKVGV